MRTISSTGSMADLATGTGIAGCLFARIEVLRFPQSTVLKAHQGGLGKRKHHVTGAGLSDILCFASFAKEGDRE